MTNINEQQSDSLIISEIQLILAEKRTSLAALRTAIALLVVPLSVLSVLIATSRYYDIVHVMHLMVPLLIISCGLILIGFYLVIRSIIQIRRQDRMIKHLKETSSSIKPLIEV